MPRKGNKQKKTIYRMGKNIYKQCDQQAVNIQNRQAGQKLNIKKQTWKKIKKNKIKNKHETCTLSYIK